MQQEKDKQESNEPAEVNKDELSQEDIENGIKTFEQQPQGHEALETAEGKNNGAKPAAYKNQQSNHP